MWMADGCVEGLHLYGCALHTIYPQGNAIENVFVAFVPFKFAPFVQFAHSLYGIEVTVAATRLHFWLSSSVAIARCLNSKKKKKKRNS